MLYSLATLQDDIATPLRSAARSAARLLLAGAGQAPEGFALRQLAAALDVLGGLAVTHRRPPFGFTTTRHGNADVAVREEVVMRTPFASLLRFAKDGVTEQPKVLVVAPMSGHFATLLRGTVETMLPDFDVHITDWHNPRDIPLSAGEFGFDDYVAHVMEFLRAMGQGSHVLAVCQPSVPVLAAAAIMAEDRDRCGPRSMTLMAGPIDTRVSPTKVNKLANEHPITWFEKNLIATVPWRFAGGGRRVYPGHTQLTAFVSMNLGRHIAAHIGQMRSIFNSDAVAAATHTEFYEEYFAVMDLPAAFFLETVSRIFQQHQLATGTLEWRGRPVRPESIRRAALMVVEGERDDICSVGQTMAALDLCRSIPVNMRHYHLQTGVGHYGVFNGRRWQTEIYPKVREMIESMS
ncbi:polyhydroxyalkanoate depolymerase [Roseomonas hellenica]|uniref:Polyhydroxyalkanoate depolymerase n=1 Tax=Plastoroseomonas hellenica TaxID=2687306 RepID=A0ABS5EUV0_9PROT|nr:polyhydroxyalkanoate depolymerase [Plastoroseomonas hellenica]MBR0664044.1 polyhydroxyalkanoate depolymerase [Plastoroseomonas hellenica]